VTFHRAAYFPGRKTTAARPETQKSIGSVAYFEETHVKVAAVDTMGSTPATCTAPQIGRLAKSAAHTTVTCEKRLVVCRSVGQRANQLHHTPVSSHQTSSNKDGFKFKSDCPTWPRMWPLRRSQPTASGTKEGARSPTMMLQAVYHRHHLGLPLSFGPQRPSAGRGTRVSS
jgi:hypothetical protein